MSDSDFLDAVQAEVIRARNLFPTNKHMLAVMAEEAGEVCKAMLDRDNGTAADADVYEECVQTAAMCLRLAVEGDSDFKYKNLDK